jgi:hypothetical protein
MEAAVQSVAEPNHAVGSDGVNPPNQSPEIVILGVAGSSPVSHPFGSFGPCVADVRRGEPLAAYHGDDAYRNASRAKTLLDSPALYQRRYLSASPAPQPSSSSLEFGSLLHQWFEEGPAFLGTLATPPESTLTSTGLVGKQAREWAAENLGPGVQLVSPAIYAQVQNCIAAIQANPAAVRLMDRVCEREVSVRWEYRGHKLRCRYDQLTSDGIVVDLKTTSDQCIRTDFAKSVIKWKYHLSEAWYRRGMEACGMEPAPMRYIVVSTSQTYDCEVVTLPAAVVAEGQRLMDAALTDLQIREDLGWWLPDSHGEEVELEFPSYLTRGY